MKYLLTLLSIPVIYASETVPITKQNSPLQSEMSKSLPTIPSITCPNDNTYSTKITRSYSTTHDTMSRTPSLSCSPTSSSYALSSHRGLSNEQLEIATLRQENTTLKKKLDKVHARQKQLKEEQRQQTTLIAALIASLQDLKKTMEDGIGSMGSIAADVSNFGTDKTFVKLGLIVHQQAEVHESQRRLLQEAQEDRHKLELLLASLQESSPKPKAPRKSSILGGFPGLGN